MNKALMIHTHTSGLSNQGAVTDNNQLLTIALAVLNTETFKISKKVQFQLKFDFTKYSWNNSLVKIHGIAREDATSGCDPDELIAYILEYINDNFDLHKEITLSGNNVSRFHLPFLLKLFKDYDFADIKFGNVIDINTLAILKGYTSIYSLIKEEIGDDELPQLSSSEHLSLYAQLFRSAKQKLTEDTDD